VPPLARPGLREAFGRRKMIGLEGWGVYKNIHRPNQGGIVTQETYAPTQESKREARIAATIMVQRG